MDIYPIQTKHCNKCDITKSLTEFPKNTTKKCGYASHCNECNRLRVKLHTENNKENKKAYKKEYYAKNKKAIALSMKKRRDTDPLYNLKVSIRAMIGGKLRKHNYTKTSRTYEILGCSYEEFKVYIESKFLEGMNWENRSEWHLDHIIPVSYGLNEEEILALNHYSNLQPLWAIDNLSKSNRYIG